jgi:hypothetical protein
MNTFKDFNIAPKIQAFQGDKIKIERILNKQILVEDFKIDISKYGKGNGKVLTLQLTLDREKRVLFTGSVTLMDMIEQVSKENFPFTTTIIKENERYQFT